MAVKIAAIITSFNRRKKTLACLRSLSMQDLPSDVSVAVYLLDDASSDGTADAVRAEFPKIRLLSGNGNYFWNGGMRIAFQAAIDDGYDFYLWLNDDVVLYTDFLAKLLEAHETASISRSFPNIIVGAVRDPKTSELTYSGFNRASRWHPFKFEKLTPNPSRLLECETMNGNCVLIPSAVPKDIGNLDPIYVQRAGDMDYGFRARKAGAKIWIAQNYVGECEPNQRFMIWGNPELTVPQRLKLLNTPHGLQFRPWFHFARKHGGPFWLIFAILPYLKMLLPSVYARRFRNKNVERSS
jgi:GT2 family glycosyltransferase